LLLSWIIFRWTTITSTVLIKCDCWQHLPTVATCLQQPQVRSTTAIAYNSQLSTQSPDYKDTTTTTIGVYLTSHLSTTATWLQRHVYNSHLFTTAMCLTNHLSALQL
jgi:hypothetical protein